MGVFLSIMDLLNNCTILSNYTYLQVFCDKWISWLFTDDFKAVFIRGEFCKPLENTIKITVVLEPGLVSYFNDIHVAS